jgi:hypothetical protein
MLTLCGPDPLSQHYAPQLEGVYDCVDRITINAYFPIAQTPGGFRTWWRDLFDSDDHLDNTHLMRLAGRFSRRMRGWAKKHEIPVIDCRAGERKHEIGEQYLPTDPTRTGIFCVLVNRAPAPIWDVQRYGDNGINLRRKEPFPYVNHYFFHIWDADWGHLTIRMCGHPPFGALIILNGHEYVANQATRQGIRFTKEGNCFTDWDDAADLNQVADTLRQPDAIGRLEQVLRHWLSRCLCLALDVAEQQKMHCQYAFSIYQAEYSRNLLFRSGRDLETVFQGLIDRTRAALDLKTVTTIFGYKHRPNTRERTHREPRLRVVTERPTYDLTVFKIHCGSLTGPARTFMTIGRTLRGCARSLDLVYRPPSTDLHPVAGGRRWRARAPSWTRSWNPSPPSRIPALISIASIPCPASWSSPCWPSSPAPPGPPPSPAGPSSRGASSRGSSTCPTASPVRMSSAAS